MKRLFALLSLLVLLTACDTGHKRQLNLFSWAGIFDPAVIREFEELYDCSVVLDTYESNEAMYAKFKLAPSGFDVIVPSNYFFALLVEQDLLRQIDWEKLPNGNRFNAHVSAFGAPYFLSYTGIGYQKQRIENFVPSWTIFSRQDLKGRMTLLNDMREALGASLITLGFDINTRSREELELAADQLLRWKRNIAKFESEQYKNGLASAEYLAVQGYASDILQVMQEEENVNFAFPDEGALMSVDYLAISAKSKHPDLAEAFIDHMLKDTSIVKNERISFTLTYMRHQNEPLPDIGVISIPTPSEAVKKKSQMIRNIGDALPLYLEAWERVLTDY